MTNTVVITDSCFLIEQEITCLICYRKIRVDKIKNILSAKSDSKLGDSSKASSVKVFNVT